MTNPFQQPLLTYSPAMEPPGWNLLRDLLQRKIFQLQGNPYGYNPESGQSQQSLWTGGGRGLFDPVSGTYGQGGGAQGGGGTPGGGGGDMGTLGPLIQKILAGGQGGKPGMAPGRPLQPMQQGTPPLPGGMPAPQQNPTMDGTRLGYDAGYSPIRGGEMASSHAIKNSMNRHMMLRALMAHLAKRSGPPRRPMPTRPIGHDARMPVSPVSPDTNAAGGIPRTIAGGTNRPPMDTPSATTTPRSGTAPPRGGGGTSGGGGGGGWGGGGSRPTPTPSPRPDHPYGRNWWDVDPTSKKPRFPSGAEAGGAKDGRELGKDSPYMFQRGPVGPLGMDGPVDNSNLYGVGGAGGTWVGFHDQPGTGFMLPTGADLGTMLTKFLSTQSSGGGGGGGGGAAAGGMGAGPKRRRRQFSPLGSPTTTLGSDGFMDQPNNAGGRDFGMRSGENVGPYMAPERPALADATAWGNW